MAAMSSSLFWMVAAVFAAPLLARLLRGHAPEVVVLLLLGVLIGPHALGLASTTGIEMIKQLGPRRRGARRLRHQQGKAADPR